MNFPVPEPGPANNVQGNQGRTRWLDPFCGKGFATMEGLIAHWNRKICRGPQFLGPDQTAVDRLIVILRLQRRRTTMVSRQFLQEQEPKTGEPRQ